MNSKDAKKRNEEIRKENFLHVQWMLGSFFVAAFSLLLFIRLQELVIWYPQLFDNGIMEILLITATLLCVVAFSRSLYLYRRNKGETLLIKKRFEESEKKKKIRKDPLGSVLEEAIINLGIINRENRDERKLGNIVILVFVITLLVVGLVFMGLLIFHITLRPTDTVQIVIEAIGTALGFIGGGMLLYFGFVGRQGEERMKSDEMLGKIVLEEVGKLEWKNTTEENASVKAKTKKETLPNIQQKTIIEFLWMPSCPACKRAKDFLDEKKVNYRIRNINEDAPTSIELIEWCSNSGVEIKSFFNTRSKAYRLSGLKEKLPSLSTEECLNELVGNSLLLKRPIIILDKSNVILSFKVEKWEKIIFENYSGH